MEKMLCPYRKRIVSEVPTFEKEIKGTTQSEKMFAECQDIIDATIVINRAAFALEHPEQIKECE